MSKKGVVVFMLGIVVCGLIGLALGLTTAYVISGPLAYFGATMVTMETIVKLWVGWPVALTIVGIAVGLHLGDK